MPDETTIEMKPNAGPQEAFLACGADVALYGGAAGGGKSWALLNDPVRWAIVPGFDAVIFRRTMPMVTRGGGLWQKSFASYPLANGTPREYDHTWRFPVGASIAFSHMQHEKNRFDWQGAELAFIGFDELTHFTRDQFMYMLSRNRSTCGVRPYIRATCNPDPNSFVLEFVDWYLDEDGYVDPARDGATRWFARDGETMVWAEEPDSLRARGFDPLSFCFITADLRDNPKLTNEDPHYASNLKALPSWERARLLGDADRRGGNWYAQPAAGEVFHKSWFELVASVPMDGRAVRHWDRAATRPTERNPDPDWTVGLLLREAKGVAYVCDIERFRGTPAEVRSRIKATASQDGPDVAISIEEEPGSSGKADAADIIRMLAGYNVRATRPTGSKVSRAGAVSAQAEFGNVKLLRAHWVTAFLDELQGFPEGDHDDQVDGLSGAYNFLTSAATPRFESY